MNVESACFAVSHELGALRGPRTPRPAAGGRWVAVLRLERLSRSPSGRRGEGGLSLSGASGEQPCAGSSAQGLMFGGVTCAPGVEREGLEGSTQGLEGVGAVPSGPPGTSPTQWT